MLIKAVIFDWGRVLGRGDRDYIRRVAAEYGLTLEEAVAMYVGPAGENSLVDRQFGVAELVDSMAAALSERLGERAAELAARLCAIYDDPERQTPITDMIALFGELHRSGVALALLGNGPSESRPVMHAHLGDLMPAVVWLSGERGVGKPARAAYVGVADELGVDVSECVFIDDLATNVQGARDAGMHALQFAGDVQAVRDGLQELGLGLA
jgi:HAD superfamily hydrolase (TIGR01509 family)